MKLGLVTYNMAKDWDVPTIIENCVETGFSGVELRTTHAHGVEIDLSASERAAVKQQFADSPIEIAGLGSAYDYHATDQAVVRRNIAGNEGVFSTRSGCRSPRRQGASEWSSQRSSRRKDIGTDRVGIARVW